MCCRVFELPQNTAESSMKADRVFSKCLHPERIHVCLALVPIVKYKWSYLLMFCFVFVCLFFPLESFIHIIMQVQLHFDPMCLFPVWSPPLFAGRISLFSMSLASFLATMRSVSFPMVFTIRGLFHFRWYFALWGYGISLAYVGFSWFGEYVSGSCMSGLRAFIKVFLVDGVQFSPVLLS